MWFPGYEQRYNEVVDQRVVQALASEYINYSVPSADWYLNPYPGNAVFYDVYSDSLLVIPRLQNYADPTLGYFDRVVYAEQEVKP